ncbi:hypothetical protein RZS08_21405, partial [Arthrospira platensis SPKY1]|nr:hypothetical protein [Arthrospira platensis SPKY1]
PAPGAPAVLHADLLDDEAQPLDEGLPALGTEGALAFMAGDPGDVDIPESRLARRRAGAIQGPHRRGGQVGELVQRVEAGQVERNVRSQFGDDPLAHRAKLVEIVVQGGNDQMGDFEMHPRGLELFQGRQHGGQLAAADVPIKDRIETLEIDVGRVQLIAQRGERFAGDGAAR